MPLRAVLLHQGNGLVGIAAGFDQPPEDVPVDVVGAGAGLALRDERKRFPHFVNSALDRFGVGLSRSLVLVIGLRRQDGLDVSHAVSMP